MNKRVSEEQLKGDYGLRVGKSISCRASVMDKTDLVSYELALTTAGSNARMAVTPLPVKSNSRSGNQGITVMQPKW